VVVETMSNTFSCGHERTPENTKMKASGKRRKDGTLRKQAYCRRCYNDRRAAAWRRNNPPKGRPVTWEVEIKVRRSGKLVAHTKDRTYAVKSMLWAAQAELAVLRHTLNR
jgi:hypothetical protein